MCACVQTQGLHIRSSLRWLLGRIARMKIHFCGFRRFMKGQAAFPTRPLLGEKSKDLWSLAQCANHISDATLAAWAHPSPSLCFPLYTPFFLFYIPSISYSRSPVMIYCPSLSSNSFFSLSLWEDLGMSHSWRIPGASERCYPLREMTTGIDLPTSRSIAKRLFPTHAGTDRTIHGDVLLLLRR